MDGIMGGWGGLWMVLWLLVGFLVVGLALYGLVRLLQDLGRRGGDR
ncbi:MAG TPA: hypothetical protein VM778_10785 [Gemmatimonadota bacterium]|nr:hypothetical protein [Gemmatimonadota bacterium]